MKCSWLCCELGFLYVFTRAMGCFFGCFRVRDDRRRPRPHLVSQALRSRTSEAVISRNGLSSLFLVEDGEGSPRPIKDNHVLGSPQPGIGDKELKDEAKFLKACGTLVETPVEIRRTAKLEGSMLGDDDLDPAKFHSWLPNTSIKKLHLDERPCQIPAPVKICEECRKVSGSSEATPISSCVCNGRSSFEGNGVESVLMNSNVQAGLSDKRSVSSVSPGFSAVNDQRSKTVRFECEIETPFLSSGDSSSDLVGEHSKKTDSLGNHSVSRPSPYPTPLKLNDDMQTPGTVFPRNLENIANGKNGRIRSQYVHSVLNPVENFSQWKVLKEADSNSHQLPVHLRESLEQFEKATVMSEGGERETSDEIAMEVDGSLSSWLKPRPTTQDGNNQFLEAISGRNPHFGKTPGDRPILGTVATHWYENEDDHISPRWWDGNGIPNSTNKYKEDQKVSWHATPFEERLEKALSEESLISQRRHSGPPLVFDENEECDTAISQMQSSTHPKSVVSF